MVVPPMVATPGPLPSGPGWAYEYKWDGVRAVVHAEADQVRALSRNQRDITLTYPELREVGELLRGRPVVLDGEIVALDPAARRPSPSSSAACRSRARPPDS